ncbi:hypothetical protein INR49_013197, partial [Caranx melampygus]
MRPCCSEWRSEGTRQGNNSCRNRCHRDVKLSADGKRARPEDIVSRRNLGDVDPLTVDVGSVDV